MKKIKTLFMLAMLMFAITIPAHSQGNLVVNGDFSNASGWTLATGTSISSNGYLYMPSYSGSATQLVTSLTPAMSYIVSGEYQGTTSGSKFNIYINGKSAYDYYILDNNWKTFSFLYIAIAPSITLCLDKHGPSAFKYDNISMVAVPEPSTWALVLTCGIAVFLIWFFQRKHF